MATSQKIGMKWKMTSGPSQVFQTQSTRVHGRQRNKWLTELKNGIACPSKSLDKCKYAKSLWWEQPASTLVAWETVDGQTVAACINHMKQLVYFGKEMTRYGHCEFTVMPFGVNQCTNGFYGLDEPGSRGSFEVSVGAAEEGEVVCLVSKCEFWLQEVRFLRHVVTKNRKYEWGREQEEAFQTLKDNLCNTPILSLPYGPEDFVVYYKVVYLCKEGSEIRYHPRKANVVADALSRKKIVKPRRVCAMSMTISQVLRKRYWMLQVRRPRFPRSSSGYDTNWVIVDRLTKSAYFLAIREDYKIEKLARLYIDEIVAGHGVPVSIILDRDGRFTSRVLDNITESFRDVIIYESLVMWAEIRESRLIGSELVQETTDKVVLIMEKLKAVRDSQKSYADNRRKLLEFEVEDQVLLKMSPWKGVTRFGKKCKLAPRYVGPFEILEREPIEIMDHEVKSLKCSKIPIVKVRWNSKLGLEFTWERKDHMKAKYPRLFVDCTVEPTS
nr:hypothetical protein [Tanacetum cinerariifolium]